MLLVCNWFHDEMRVLGEIPGEGISVKLCDECREKLKAESAAVIAAARIQPVRIDKHASA